MSISEIANRALYTGTGSLDTFGFSFTIDSVDDIEVYLDGVLQSSGYTVNLTSELTGNVVFSSAPASGVAVLLIRDTPISQAKNFENGDTLYADDVEAALDKLTRAIKDAREVADRCLRFNRTSTNKDVFIPDLVASKYLKVNAAGDGIILTEGSVEGASVLSELSDVSVAGVTNGQALVYDQEGSLWIPGEAGGGGGGFTMISLNPTGTSTRELNLPGTDNYLIYVNSDAATTTYCDIYVVKVNGGEPTEGQMIIVKKANGNSKYFYMNESSDTYGIKTPGNYTTLDSPYDTATFIYDGEFWLCTGYVDNSSAAS